MWPVGNLGSGKCIGPVYYSSVTSNVSVGCKIQTAKCKRYFEDAHLRSTEVKEIHICMRNYKHIGRDLF